MAFALGARAEAAGHRLAAFETIGSTSEEALKRARAGDPGHLWVVSAEQSAGRGRRGRVWQTPRGNLAATLLLVGGEAPALSARLGFVAGLALHRAIAVALPSGETEHSALRLKWPNDVLLDGAKVSGILLQAASLPGGRNAVAVGIGVNVCHAPDDVPYPATSLAAAGIDVSAEALFAALADEWVEAEAVWRGGNGFAEIRDRWLERAAGLGSLIAIRQDEDVVSGAFETIDSEGRLVLRSTDGMRRTVNAGDVHFGNAATIGA